MMDGKCFFFVWCIVGISLAANPRVNTPLGIIEGTIGYTYTGSPFFQFEGIPYAAPPVGDLRYENPQDPQKWQGILTANVRTACFQYSQVQFDAFGNYATTGDEDCLYYNVYTPTLNSSAKLDVLVFFHPGAFMFANGGNFRPDIILNRPVVYISLNYRLGPLGFLSTEDDVLPGNLGLRDQQQALRWIKKNLRYFGGNPNSITIHGSSAGSASVQFHYILPGSRGLFHRGIAQSGAVLNDWVIMKKPLEHAQKLAYLVGCPTDSSRIIKNCLKSKSARVIVQNVQKFQPFLYNPFSPWAVVIDGYWASQPVLPDHPLKLLLNKQIYDVPLLMSHVTSEGLYPGSDFYASDEYLEAIDTRWNELMPHIMMYNYTVDHRIIDDVSQAIRHRYLEDERLTRGPSYLDLIQAMGDRNFVVDIEKSLRLHSAGMESPLWSYVFNYRGNQSMSDSSAETTKNLGVSHGDDLMYVLRLIRLKDPGTPDDIAMANLMVDLTVSFMSQGRPNISAQWKPLSKNVRDPLNLLQINRYDELVPLEANYLGERPFWDSLPFNENERLLNITLDF